MPNSILVPLKTITNFCLSVFSNKVFLFQRSTFFKKLHYYIISIYWNILLPLRFIETLYNQILLDNIF